MKIECKLKRPGGTHVTLGGAKYHFAPQADGAHVADVADEAHQDRLLGIAEAYRIYRAKSEPAKTETKPAEPEPVDGDTDGDGDADRDDLVAQYAAKFGKKPHHKWNADKIRAELAEG
jgi:hypothetical protein